MRAMIAASGTLDGVIDIVDVERRLLSNRPYRDPVKRALDRSLRAERPANLRSTPPSLSQAIAAVTSLPDRFAHRRLQEFIPETPDKMSEVWKRWRSSLQLAPLVERLERCDILIVNGEGSVRKNDPSGRLAFFLAWVVARILRKPVAFSNHLCELKHPNMLAFAQLVYPALQQITVRGNASLAEARTTVPSASNLTWAPDAAFGLTPAPREAFLKLSARPGYYDLFPSSAHSFHPDQPYVCLGASALYQDGPIADRDATNWFRSLASGIQKRAQVVLMAHDYPDQILFARIAIDSGYPLIPVQTPIPQVTDILANANAYVGGRWHSGVLAATGGTPILRLESNSAVKTRDMDDFVVLPSEPLSLQRRDDVTTVLGQLDYVLERETELRSEGRERVRTFPARTHQHIAMIRSEATEHGV
jgi:polysaccharide pyruvyl transferase WcaK-like protein